MKAIFKLFFYIVLLVAPLITQAATITPALIEVRRPSADKLEKFKSARDFQYETDYTHKIGLWEMFTRWLGRILFHRIFYKSTWDVLRVLEYTIALLAVIFIVYFFVRSDRKGIFTRGPKKLTLDIEGAEEDIHQLDFEKLIREAIAGGEYRVAIRYMYLKLLKELSDNNLINWKTEKTNRDYINELRATNYGNKFREVTLLFDYAWYGETPVNENMFGQIQHEFTTFYSQLQASS